MSSEIMLENTFENNFFFVNSVVILLFQPVSVAHLIGDIHKEMQARAPKNPVRKVVWF